MSNMILTPMFPAKKLSPHHQPNDILGRKFGVPAQITATLWHTRHVTASELLCMYIITLPQTHLNSTLQSHTMDDLLEFLLFSLPCNMAI